MLVGFLSRIPANPSYPVDSQENTPSTSRSKFVRSFGISITKTPKDSEMGVRRGLVEDDTWGSVD